MDVKLMQLGREPRSERLPAGALGHTVATLLGHDPKTEFDEDMLRFKSLIQEGKATADNVTVTRSEVEAGFEL